MAGGKTGGGRAKEGKKDSSKGLVENICINWKITNFQDIFNIYGLAPEWEPELPSPGSTADQKPSGKIALYGESFTTGNFWLSITKFLCDFLDVSGIHISQLHPFGFIRLRHFEFCCKALGVEPTVDRFLAIYKIQTRGSWFSFQVQRKAIGTEPPRSAHEWKNKSTCSSRLSEMRTNA